MKTFLIIKSSQKTKAVVVTVKPGLKGTIFAWDCWGHLQNLRQNTLGVNIEGGLAQEYSTPKCRQKAITEPHLPVERGRAWFIFLKTRMWVVELWLPRCNPTLTSSLPPKSLIAEGARE